jgi:hypothetical protein
MKAALGAYANGEKVMLIRANPNVGGGLHYWLKRKRLPMRGHVKREPDPHVRAAVMAYAEGKDHKKAIQERFRISSRTFYLWIDRLGVPRRRVQLKGKDGRTLSQRFSHCDWCKEPLSPDQIRRRRKYCCRACQTAGVEAIKRSNCAINLCPAPGCGVEIEDDSPYCSWQCHKAAMEERFG